jgi:hypothetical protein
MRLPANQSATVEVAFINANGVVVETQGPVQWFSTVPGVATVTPDPDDDHLATITAGPSAGNTNISAVADADLGEGVRNVEAVLELIVIARGEAVGGEITPVGIDMPGQGLPGQPNTPDQGLPPGVGRPDNTLPGSQPGAGNELPGGLPNRPGQGLPGTPEPK